MVAALREKDREQVAAPGAAGKTVMKRILPTRRKVREEAASRGGARVKEEDHRNKNK